MTPEEWTKTIESVKEEMRKHARKFATPISMTEDQQTAVAWGSGSYLQNGDTTWLITADHNFDKIPSGGLLAHLPAPGDHYVAVTNTPRRAAYPVNVAAVEVAAIPTGWDRQAVPKARVARRFSAVKEELLFWVGYPGYNLIRHDPVIADRIKATLYGELRISSLSVLSQELQTTQPIGSGFDPLKHVAIHYPSMGRSEADGPEIDLPNPKGLSGSLLWNTRYVETVRASSEWTPELAQVCGVIWYALDKPDVVFATRIEVARLSFPGVFA